MKKRRPKPTMTPAQALAAMRAQAVSGVDNLDSRDSLASRVRSALGRHPGTRSHPSPNRRLSLEEVLDEFFYSVDKPSPDVVLRACEAHPEYRADIVEFAALWSSYEAAPETIEDDSLAKVTNEDVSLLQSFILNRLHELDSSRSRRQPHTHPMPISWKR